MTSGGFRYSTTQTRRHRSWSDISWRGIYIRRQPGVRQSELDIAGEHIVECYVVRTASS